MGTSVARSSVFKTCLTRRAETYGIDWDVFSDESPYEMRAKIAPAIKRARENQRPTVLEISTYRYYGFTIADSMHRTYRTLEEIEARKARDPMMLWGRSLEEEGILDQAGLEEISEQAKSEASAAVRFAGSGPLPTISDISTDVYWEIDHAPERAKAGRYFFSD